MKDCNGSCIAKTECCGGCRIGQKCENGSCVTVATCPTITCTGYTLTSCPANTICYPCTKQTANCTREGTVYKKAACQKGYKDCNGSCISESECCGDCASNQKCENGTCVTKTCTNTCFYTLRSCPANGYCKSCTIIGSDCSTASGGTRYSLVSCHNGTYISSSGNSCVSY